MLDFPDFSLPNPTLLLVLVVSALIGWLMGALFGMWPGLIAFAVTFTILAIWTAPRGPPRR